MSDELNRVQVELLRRIVATNGGGVYALDVPKGTLCALERRGLVQGKRGMDGWVVHTSEGLALVRKQQKEPKA